jgi:hypothetical protein
MLAVSYESPGKILADFGGIYQLGAKGRLIIGSSSGSDPICRRTGADV